jgi:hypothetical protein
MQAKQVLHNVLRETCSDMHKVRRNALAATVMAALEGQSLTVTHLGRAIRSDAQERHCIKRADRLLSNGHLHMAYLDIYACITRWLIGSQTRPVIVVDWSDMDECKRHYLLRASIPLQGRSLTLYEEVHTVKTKDKPKTHLAFLRKLHAMVPVPCCPIIVSDAGFRVPWFKQVESFGWDWVGRVRHRNWISFDDANWVMCPSLHPKATSTPKALGEATLTRSNPHTCRLVLYKGKAKGRVHLTRLGEQARSSHSRKHARAQREPWLLATSLAQGTGLAKKAVKIYRLRMQIEEAFRDLKSTRFGLSLELHLTYQVKRLQVLLLIATLALLVAWLIGKATELTGQHRQYQANTVKNRMVLSTIFIGLRVIGDRRVSLRLTDVIAARQRLLDDVAHNCQ